MSKFRKYNIGVCFIMILLLYFFEKTLSVQQFDFWTFMLYSGWACVIVEIGGVLFAKALGYRYYLLKGFRYFITVVLTFNSLITVMIALGNKYGANIHLIVTAFNIIVLFLCMTGIFVGDMKILYKNHDIDISKVSRLVQKPNSLFIHTQDRVYKLTA